MLALAIAVDVGARVVGCFTGSFRVALCADSACLESSTSHCNVAILVALEVLGHFALTI